MSTILIGFIILLLVFFGMSMGVIFGKKPIAGSCGGKANCEICN